MIAHLYPRTVPRGRSRWLPASFAGRGANHADPTVAAGLEHPRLPMPASERENADSRHQRLKERRLTRSERLNPELGDQYAYVALGPRSKLVLAHAVGKREPRTTRKLMRQVRKRVQGRSELSTDGFMD